MNGFQNAERLGRKIMDKVLNDSSGVTKYEFTKGEFDYDDANLISSTTSGQVECIMEIKYRIHNDKKTGELKGYDSTDRIVKEEGALLECAKLKSLIDFNKPVTFYTMLFKDGIGYRFNLNEIDYNSIPTVVRMLPRTTYGNTQKVPTQCKFLKLELGHKFTFKKYMDGR